MAVSTGTAILGAAALGAGGSALAGRQARKAGEASAAAQREASQLAAEEGRFTPYSLTTRYGRSMFGFDPEGRLESAGYEATPEIRALQDRLSALYGTSLGQAEAAQAAGMPLGEAARGLFNLAGQYIGESPEAAEQRIFNRLQEISRPTQEQEERRLEAGVFGRGRVGLNISGVGQPELYSLARAREQQRAADAYTAMQQAQQRVGFGTGLFGSAAGLLGTQYGLQTQALSPFQTQFGVSQLLEQAAQQPLDIGAQLGGRSATAGANVGESLLRGGLGAAQTQLQGSLVGPSLMAQNLSGFGQQYLRGRQQQDLFNQLAGLQTARTYGTTPMSQQTGMLQAQWDPRWG